MRNTGWSFGYERNCAMCGKEIITRPGWAYKRGYKKSKETYYCSWPCLQRALKEEEEQTGKKRDGIKPIMVDGHGVTRCGYCDTVLQKGAEKCDGCGKKVEW